MGPRLASGRCLPGGPGREPRTMLPGGRGPRRVAPVRGAGRRPPTRAGITRPAAPRIGPPIAWPGGA